MRSKSAKRMVGKWINVPKRQDFRFWHMPVERVCRSNVRFREATNIPQAAGMGAELSFIVV